MRRFVYQQPVGVWKQSPVRKLLWAVEQTLHRIERDIPEQGDVDKWAGTFRKTLNDPVQDFDWKGWYADHVEKADPDVPADIVAAWEALPDDVREMYQQAGEVRTSTIGLPFDPDDLEKALDETMHLVRNIPESQRDALRNLMRLSLENEEGQFKFARRIRAEWGTISKARSELIAITEWNRAASTATLLGLKKDGVTKKRWFTVGDSRVCSQCRDAAAVGEIDIDHDFPGVGAQAPPGHPGCRCNVSGA